MLKKIESPIGPLLAEVAANGIRQLSFEGEALILGDKRGLVPDGPDTEALLERLEQELQEYFGGERRSFDLPLDLSTGTPFRQSVWRTIASIPFGETLTYADVAIMSGAPNAYRAAGSACGANPIVILVPCHRVVGSDGGLHGFGGGLDVKDWLLRHEGGSPHAAVLKRARSRQAALLV
jgi:methylated-DNA-[protein]-cysteine S-methyltransferase